MFLVIIKPILSMWLLKEVHKKKKSIKINISGDIYLQKKKTQKQSLEITEAINVIFFINQ